MTIATLYTKNGKDFIYHGSHETFFVYKKMQTFEHCPLNDIPFGLGLVDDFTKLFKDHEISLESNYYVNFMYRWNYRSKE